MRVKQILKNCLAGGGGGNRDVNLLVVKCHSIATVYLRMKASTQRLYLFHGERMEDLAWDFIADLFEKDAEGELKIFREFFRDKELELLDEQDVIIELRKLVFTKVEDNIFRSIGELDPSVRKIIRNLKLAYKNGFEDNEVRLENGWLICGSVDKDSNLTMPSEIIQSKLCYRVHEKMQIPEILDQAIDILRVQDEYPKKINLTSLALVIREVFLHFNRDLLINTIHPQHDQVLISNEYSKFLDLCVEKVKQRVGDRYVKNGKKSTDMMITYLKAARNILNIYDHNYYNERTHYETLKEELPDLSYEQFRDYHRKILEYLVKQIRSEMLNMYKWEVFDTKIMQRA